VPTGNVTPVQGFGRVGLASGLKERTIYLKATGTSGQVRYTGVRVEGPENISVKSVQQYGTVVSSYSWWYRCYQRVVNVAEFPSGTTEASFNVLGTSVNGKHCKVDETFGSLPANPI